MVRHDVVLAGAAFAGRGMRPVILERTDDEFVPNILRDLGTEPGRASIMSTIARPPVGSRSGRLKLYQPVHHTFHVVLLETACDEVGRPRLDPRRIDSMGVVLRRVARRADAPARDEALQGWIQAGRKLRVWHELTAADQDADPDYTRRPPALKAGHPEIDRRLALLRAAAGEEPLVETVSPIFLAPPEVCRAVGRTLLYGVLPLASSERTEAPEESGYSAEVVQRRLPTYFKEATHIRAVPRADATVGPEGVDDAALRDYIGMLAQITYEFEAFRDTSTGQAVLAALNRIELPYSAINSRGERIEITRSAGGELRKAAALLVERQASTSSIQMPLRWPPITRAQADAITTAVTAALTMRFTRARQDGFVTGTGRYEDPASVYKLRAFIRAKSHDGCPPRLHWSDYSEPFRIAPWYDTNPAASPAQVVVPDITSGNVSRIKPNVAFKVPESIFNVIERNKKLDNLGQPGLPQIGLGWICGFNIPVITLCAFIVLHIFLQLFEVIFRWLVFVKICIPFPTISAPPAED